MDLRPNGTIRVSQSMQTNDPDIYAVGDCACVTDAVTGEPLWSPMGSSANIEGRIAARHIAGKPVAYGGAVGTGICKLPNLHVGRTGLTEVAARERGYDGGERPDGGERQGARTIQELAPCLSS